MNYRFETTTTMKEYNSRKWWIDGDYIRPVTIQAETVKEALTLWREFVEERYWMTISNNALKNADPMYIDTEDGGARQVGYVITGKTYFDDRDTGRSNVMQFVDLWVNISAVTFPDFD